MPNVYTDSANNFGATQITVDGTGNTLLIPARTSRSGFMITIEGTSTGKLYYSAFSPVTIGSSGYLPCTDGAWVSIPFNGAMYGLASTGSQIVTVEELY